MAESESTKQAKAILTIEQIMDNLPDDESRVRVLACAAIQSECYKEALRLVQWLVQEEEEIEARVAANLNAKIGPTVKARFAGISTREIVPIDE